MGMVSSYDQKALELRLRETYFDYLINYINTNIESGAVIAPTTMGVDEPILMGLVQQLNDLRIQRGELTEKNVYYAKYTKDIENVKTAIGEVVSSMRASLEIEKEDLRRRTSEAEREIKKLPEPSSVIIVLTITTIPSSFRSVLKPRFKRLRIRRITRSWIKPVRRLS